MSYSARTIGGWRLRQAVRNNPVEYPNDARRPRTRADCADIARPCPYVSCRYNLYLDVNEYGGIVFSSPGIEPDEMRESCALDVAEQGELSLEEAGELLGLKKSAVSFIEQAAKVKAWAKSSMRPFDDRDNQARRSTPKKYDIESFEDEDKK